MEKGKSSEIERKEIYDNVLSRNDLQKTTNTQTHKCSTVIFNKGRKKTFISQ